MMNKKKFLLIAGIILAVGIIGSLFTYGSAQTIINESKSINSEDVTSIKVTTDNTHIKIYPTDDDKIKVTTKGRTSANTKTNLETTVEDSTLLIDTSHRRNSWFNFYFSTYELAVTIYLPEKQYDSLKIQSDNGPISMENVNINNIHAEIDNGTINFQNITSQDIELVSSNGRINLTNIVAESVHTKTNNGRVTLNNVEGTLKGKSNNGHLTLITKNIDRNIDFETDNGSITIETKKEPTNVQFMVHVNNGKTNILDKHNGNTTIGNGENLIKLTTNNGSITVTNK